MVFSNSTVQDWNELPASFLVSVDVAIKDFVS